jgi:hypothetical protein
VRGDRHLRQHRRRRRDMEGNGQRPRGRPPSSLLCHDIGERLRRPAHRHCKPLWQLAALTTQGRTRQPGAQGQTAKRGTQSRHSSRRRHSWRRGHSRRQRHSRR